jgi:hypothetical protein
VTRDRWRQLEELYQAALDLVPEERDALLERADPELRATVASILAQENNSQAGGLRRLKQRTRRGLFTGT